MFLESFCPTSLLHVAPVHGVAPGFRKRGEEPETLFKGNYQSVRELLLEYCTGHSLVTWPNPLAVEALNTELLLSPPCSSSTAPSSTSSPPPLTV